MLHAYFDESGTNAGAVVLSVAAYFGTEDQWKRFESKWCGPLGSGEFHAKDCSHLFSPLSAAMEVSEITGVLCTIATEDFRNCANAQFKSTLGNAYAVCTFACAMAVCDVAREKGIGKVSFVLEHGQPNLVFVKTVLESMLDVENTCVAAVESAGKSQFAKLHPADFTSHVASSYDRGWLQHLVERCNLKHCHITSDTLGDVSQQVKTLINHARDARRAERRNR